MNRTTEKTLLGCGLAFLPISPSKLSPDLRTLLNIRFAVNVLVCPLIILLNILVIVAVKTKRQLRTKSNVALACLATTDLVVGLLVQPLQIAVIIFFLLEISILTKIVKGITVKCVLASLYHLLLMGAERYLAIKHSFAYETQVTKLRIIIASGLAWAAAIILPSQDLWLTSSHFLTVLATFAVLFLFFPAMIYFNVSMYVEVRRNERQITANQVSLEAKEKILKNKKAFYTTTIVLLVVFLCYVPVNICFATISTFRDKISVSVRQVVFSLVTLLPELNSLFNPLIYTVRIRNFRVAFIQLLSRKTISQAEELERKIFGPRQIGIMANVKQGQNGDGQEENERHENETLNNRHVTTVRTKPQEKYEETPL